MSQSDADMIALLESARNDRLIKLFIGPSSDDDRPFLVQQTVLEDTCEYFQNALKHEESMGKEEERGTLRFEEDDREAWTILLFWILKVSLPSCITAPNMPQMLLVKCWILGDKYIIPDFQDKIMLELLRVFDHDQIELDVATKALRESAPDSVLRGLALEELIYSVYTKETIAPEQLDCIDGIPGIMCSMTKAMKAAFIRQQMNPDYVFGRVGARTTDTGELSQLWQNYMVGGGAHKHWVWDVDVDETESSDEEDAEDENN